MGVIWSLDKIKIHYKTTTSTYISIQGTKKRRRRFFLLRNMLGGKPSHSQKKRLLPLFLPPIHQHPSPQSPPKKKHPRRLRSRTHKISCTCSMTKTSWCFEKRSVFGGGGGEKYTRTSKGCNLVSQCSLTQLARSLFLSIQCFFLGGVCGIVVVT